MPSARDQHHLPSCPHGDPPISPEQLAANRLIAAEVSVIRVHEVIPPNDTGGRMAIRFVGRVKGDRVSKRLTAYLSDLPDAEPALAGGW